MVTPQLQETEVDDDIGLSRCADLVNVSAFEQLYRRHHGRVQDDRAAGGGITVGPRLPPAGS